MRVPGSKLIFSCTSHSASYARLAVYRISAGRGTSSLFPSARIREYVLQVFFRAHFRIVLFELRSVSGRGIVLSCYLPLSYVRSL